MGSQCVGEDTCVGGFPDLSSVSVEAVRSWGFTPLPSSRETLPVGVAPQVEEAVRSWEQIATCASAGKPVQRSGSPSEAPAVICRRLCRLVRAASPHLRSTWRGDPLFCALAHYELRNYFTFNFAYFLIDS
jgi:hypothetical protein